MPGAITSGYARDHREDLTQGMLALATTEDGAVPVFLRPLDGKRSEKQHRSAAVQEGMTPLRAPVPEERERRMAVVERGRYSQATMKSSNEASNWWICWVPATSTAAKAALEDMDEQWQPLSDGSGLSVGRTRTLPPGTERWVIVRMHAQVHAAQEQRDT